MAKLNEVAQWFLNKNPMSHKKLQKMCYYAQAWSYALRNKAIIDDYPEFEAWVHGPVSPALYNKYHGSGWVDLSPDSQLEEADFSESERDLLESVHVTYGGLSANELEALSHSEPPWKRARLEAGCSPYERCTVPIDVQIMKEYYYSIYTGDDR